MKKLFPFLVILFGIPTDVLVAQIPQTISYQGVLTDENGNTVANNAAVRSINSLTDRVNLIAGENIRIAEDDSSLTGAGNAWQLGGNAGTDR